MPDVNEYLVRLKNYGLANPVLVGFGIKDKAGFDAACEFAQGAIIGSAFIKALDGTENIMATTKSFLEGVLGQPE